MSDELKKTLPRIRTFASDFEHDRKESGVTLPPDVSAPHTPAPATKKVIEENIVSVAPTPAVVISETTKKGPPVTIKTPVPAFHELKKRNTPEEITTPLQKSAPEHKPLPRITTGEVTEIKTVRVRNTKKPDSPKSAYAGDATIITDNKRNKQSLIPAIIEAVKVWFKKLSANSKQNKTPKYTVVDTERRKGVIQRATTKTGTIFTADNETLKEEIRRRSWKKPADESDEPDLIWTPNTEVGYPLLDSGLPKPTNITVEFKKRAEPTLVVAPTPQPQPIVPPPVFVEPTVPEPLVIPEPALVEPTPPPAPAVSKPTEPKVLPPVPEEVIEPEYELTTPEKHYRIRSIGDVTKLNTNILSVGVVGIIAGIIIVVIVGRALLGIILSESPIATTAPATPIGLGQTVTDVALDVPTKEALLIALGQLPTSVSAHQEYRLVDKNGTPLQKSVLLPLLGFSNTGSLSQTITEVHILQNQNTRGLIFTVTDATTAFGSLLAWEGYMVENLQSVLGISQPNNSLTVTDRTIANTDVRIFTTNNQEVLVYGFVSANKVLITKDIPAFTAALGSQ